MPSTRAWIHALTKDELVKTLATYRIDTSGSIDDLRKRLKTFAEHNPEHFSGETPEPKETPTATMTDHPSTTPPPLGETMNLVRKWGCRFTGKDPLAFLERVEELRSGYGLTHEQLLRCLPELISGEPLLWYRNNREFWENWEDFVTAFRLSYLPHNNTALDREIRDRVQRPNEPFRTYATELQTMMRRLGGLSAAQQIDRIYENMRPTYRRYIRRSEVKQVGELIYLVTEQESIERAEIEYTARLTGKKNSAGSSRKEDNESITAMISPTYKRNECCWNCGQRGHRKTDCKQPFKKFCSTCGKTGVLTRDCHPPGNGQAAGERNE